jgi:hypothetical protein
MKLNCGWMHRRRRIWVPTLILAAIVLLLGASHIRVRPGIYGRVIEQGTNEPIADAIVVAHWSGRVHSLVDSQGGCWHVETARTDEHGSYHIGGWYLYSTQVGLGDELEAPDLLAYKRGYMWVQPHVTPMPSRIAMEPFRGTADERIKGLWRLVGMSSCGGPVGIYSEKNVYRLYAPILDEAKAIATTPEQLTSLHFIDLISANSMVNYDKPRTYSRDYVINVDPLDSYKKEELLK